MMWRLAMLLTGLVGMVLGAWLGWPPAALIASAFLIGWPGFMGSGSRHPLPDYEKIRQMEQDIYGEAVTLDAAAYRRKAGLDRPLAERRADFKQRSKAPALRLPD